MDNHDRTCVSYSAFETTVMIQERTIRRQWITIIILIFLFVASNLAWIYRDSQFVDEMITQEVVQDLDAEGGDAIINDGVRIYGESETDS